MIQTPGRQWQWSALINLWFTQTFFSSEIFACRFLNENLVIHFLCGTQFLYNTDFVCFSCHETTNSKLAESNEHTHTKKWAKHHQPIFLTPRDVKTVLKRNDPDLASLCRLENIPSGTFSIKLWSRLRVLTLTSMEMVSQGMFTKLL